MSTVPCAQFRYTWAERRLEGRGGGFGVVARSADWPPALLDDPPVRDALTNLAPDARRADPETAPTGLSHRRVAGGSLLVAKRPVGTDGAGRPGNYAVHALFDPTGTLGALDLVRMAQGTFALDRAVDAVPDGEAPAVAVPVAADWRTDDLGPALGALCRTLPADLVNQLAVDGSGVEDLGVGAAGAPAAVDALVGRFAEAVELGAVDTDLWWQRRGWTAAEWEAELRTYVTRNQPIHQVPDDLLWTRWDGATARGRALVATELLSRPALAEDPAAVDQLRARPVLLEAVLQAGTRRRASERAAAARWAAAAADDAQVAELARRLQEADRPGPLPEPLVHRLQQRSPDDLPDAVAGAVAAGLDGARPLDPYWRGHCLRLLLAGEPTCSHPEQLVESADEQDLVDAVAAALELDGVPADTAWSQLAALPQLRRTRVFAAAGPDTAAFLLGRDLVPRAAASRRALVALWPALGRSLGWADWARTLPGQLSTANRRLRLQRTLLLAAVALLAVAVVVLALT